MHSGKHHVHTRIKGVDMSGSLMKSVIRGSLAGCLWQVMVRGEQKREMCGSVEDIKKAKENMELL